MCRYLLQYFHRSYLGNYDDYDLNPSPETNAALLPRTEIGGRLIIITICGASHFFQENPLEVKQPRHILDIKKEISINVSIFRSSEFKLEENFFLSHSLSLFPTRQ